MEANEIKKAILSMIEGLIPLNSTWCKVKAIAGQTCTIIINELEIEDILLGFDKSGVIVYPKLNTDVLVGFIDNTKTNGAVLVVSETEKIEIMGNNYGGIGLTEKIAERLQRIEDAFFNLQNKYNAHLILFNTHTHMLGTAPTTVTTALDTATSIENVTPRTNQNYISSTKITHGNG